VGSRKTDQRKGWLWTFWRAPRRQAIDGQGSGHTYLQRAAAGGDWIKHDDFVGFKLCHQQRLAASRGLLGRLLPLLLLLLAAATLLAATAAAAATLLAASGAHHQRAGAAAS
jgi:hypothetical protein